MSFRIFLPFLQLAYLTLSDCFVFLSINFSLSSTRGYTYRDRHTYIHTYMPMDAGSITQELV